MTLASTLKLLTPALPCASLKPAAKGLRDWCHQFDLSRHLGDDALRQASLVSACAELLMSLSIDDCSVEVACRGDHLHSAQCCRNHLSAHCCSGVVNRV